MRWPRKCWFIAKFVGEKTKIRERRPLRDKKPNERGGNAIRHVTTNGVRQCLRLQ